MQPVNLPQTTHPADIFEEEAAVQVAPLRAACPPSARFIMVTATLAASVFAQLTQEFPGILPAFGPGKHCNGSYPL